MSFISSFYRVHRRKGFYHWRKRAFRPYVKFVNKNGRMVDVVRTGSKYGMEVKDRPYDRFISPF